MTSLCWTREQVILEKSPSRHSTALVLTAKTENSYEETNLTLNVSQQIFTCKDCSYDCAHYYAQVRCIIQHRTVLIIIVPPYPAGNQHRSDVRSVSWKGAKWLSDNTDCYYMYLGTCSVARSSESVFLRRCFYPVTIHCVQIKKRTVIKHCPYLRRLASLK